METSRFVSPKLKKQFHELRTRYLPIEQDPRLSKEEKIPFMIEWWTKSLQLTVESRIDRESIKELVHESGTSLKIECKSFFENCERKNIPVLVFSAGLGDVIDEWLRKETGRRFENLKIVSNFMRFDESEREMKRGGRISGFRNRLIHVFNKNESMLVGDSEIKSRPNVLLIGDSLGDVDMTVGLGECVNSVLKIGFLNDHVDKFLPAYLNAFDVVLVADNTFGIPNAILKRIL